MTQVTLTPDGMTELARRWFDYGPVMGPHERHRQPGSVQFGWLEGPQELTLEYVTTTLPPKKAFFPPRQVLFEFTLTDPPEIRGEWDDTPFTLVGVHPCDLVAIDALDEAYTTEPAEACWPAMRKRARIVGVDCMPDEYCFCTSMGTDRARHNADLFLTKIGRMYLAEVLTEAGAEMLEGVPVEEPTEDEIADAEQWREDKRERMTAKLDASVEEFADILERGGLREVWEEISQRCYSCGSCNTTCPACFCFGINDEFDIGLTAGRRVRSWDSCQLHDFALVAGGHNFRRMRWQRVKHRWHRKFLYLYRRFGRAYCTGCGRCSRSCTADINITDVSNQLIAHGRKS